jgi:4-hydroxy-tetrahydrodipicolinate synthase
MSSLKQRLRGSFTALLTPFKNGKVDEAAFQKLVDWQIKEGTNGLVPVGTTGESPTVSHAEHRRVVELCIEAAAGRVPVIAGAGSNSTSEAIELAQHAKKVKADAVLVVCPYYNRPTQEGLYLHFREVAEKGGMPIIVYNVPARTITDVSVETLARLVKLPNIVGIKDATANMLRASRQRKELGPDFIQLSGEDGTALGFNAHGGQGCISVTSNVAPKLCAEFQAATLKGDYAAALRLQEKLLPLHDALFVETNPGPLKYAAHRLGLCDAYCRLPISPVTEATKATVDAALRHAGLLS